MVKPLRFKPTLRQQLEANNKADAFLAAMAGKEPMAQAVLPAQRVRRGGGDPENAVDIDRVHRKQHGEVLHRPLEAEVIRAVEQLLRVHPRVVWATRQNAGAASFEAKSGRYAPVFFHRWVRGKGYRMSDFLGATVDGATIALEAKRIGFKGPTDQREREQAAFLQCVRDNGGRAGFVTSVDEAKKIIES